MGFNAPNNNRYGPGHSSTPVAPIVGRGAAPTGDRFRLPTPPADAFPAPVVTNVGPTMVPTSPFGDNGLPARVDVNIPDAAINGLIPMRPAPK